MFFSRPYFRANNQPPPTTQKKCLQLCNRNSQRQTALKNKELSENILVYIYFLFLPSLLGMSGLFLESACKECTTKKHQQ